MQALIPLTTQHIGDDAVQTVNARELHAFLGSKRQFADWISYRIQKYGFIENQDFASFSQICEKPLGGRTGKEFILTLDMAKELCMVETAQKAARRGATSSSAKRPCMRSRPPSWARQRPR